MFRSIWLSQSHNCQFHTSSVGPHRQAQQGCLPAWNSGSDLGSVLSSENPSVFLSCPKIKGWKYGRHHSLLTELALSSCNVMLSWLRGLSSRKGGRFTRRDSSDLTELKILWSPGHSGFLVPLSQQKKEAEGFLWGTNYQREAGLLLLHREERKSDSWIQRSLMKV